VTIHLSICELLQEHELLSIGFFGPFDSGDCALHHAKISLSTPT
jgi:hypothetical protein